MPDTKNNKAFALLAIAIVVLAALLACLALKASDKEVDITGTYDLVDYTYYGVRDGGEFEWGMSGDGVYDGEKLVIDSYENGFIKGRSILNGVEDAFVGYYDPSTKEFGYGQVFKYPDIEYGDDTLISPATGTIEDGVIYACICTVSTETDSLLTCASNFTYVKEGSTATPVDRRPAIDTYFATDKQSRCFVNDEGNPEYSETDLDVKLYFSKYVNGVYDLGLSLGKPGVITQIVASTAFQDGNSTCLRGLINDGVDVTSITSLTIYIEGDQLYLFIDSYDYNVDRFSSTYMCMTREGKQPKEYAVYPLDGMKLNTSLVSYSMDDGSSVLPTFVSEFDDRKPELRSEIPIPMKSTGTYKIVNVVPNTDRITFRPITVHDDLTFYGFMSGYVKDGKIVVHGIHFAFISEGKVDVVATGKSS